MEDSEGLVALEEEGAVDFPVGVQVENGNRRFQLSKALLSNEEKARVASTVTDAEKKTSGEILVMLVRQSDAYPGARWRLAVCFSFLVALGFYWYDHLLNPIWYLLIQAPALCIGHALAAIQPLLRLVLADVQVNEEVHQRAIEAFHSNQLNSTQDRTGILLFISLLEHRVEILADQGIHMQVKEGTWDKIVHQLLEQIHKGQLADGICHAVQDCGEILSLHFPPKPGGRNQLPNHVLIEA
jgi:putative membrane protein